MKPISYEVVRAAVEIIGAPGMEDEWMEREMRALAGDEMTARRLMDWIPEGFGAVMVSDVLVGAILPVSFSAKSADGKWHTLPMTKEPVYAAAMAVAQEIFRDGPMPKFLNISGRSSLMAAVDQALQAGVSFEGASFSGPAMLGIPAELYAGEKVSFWKRLFGG